MTQRAVNEAGAAAEIAARRLRRAETALGQAKRVLGERSAAAAGARRAADAARLAAAEAEAAFEALEEHTKIALFARHEAHRDRLRARAREAVAEADDTRRAEAEARAAVQAASAQAARADVRLDAVSAHARLVRRRAAGRRDVKIADEAPARGGAAW